MWRRMFWFGIPRDHWALNALVPATARGRAWPTRYSADELG